MVYIDQRIAFFLIFLCTCISVLSAQNPQNSEKLATIDAQVSYESDFSAEYSITEYKPNQGASITKAALFRRDRDNKYLILILEPAVDKGKGYLKIGNRLWLYEPADRSFINTSARDRFQSSNARNSDFTHSTLAHDYDIVKESRGKLGVYNTQIYTLEARHDEVTYPTIKIWVDENNLVRKFEDYSLSGQLLRTTAVPRYQAIGTRYVPVQIVIIDALLGAEVDGKFQNERTIVSVTKPSLGDLPDIIFTTAYLERVSQ